MSSNARQLTAALQPGAPQAAGGPTQTADAAGFTAQLVALRHAGKAAAVPVEAKKNFDAGKPLSPAPAVAKPVIAVKLVQPAKIAPGTDRKPEINHTVHRVMRTFHGVSSDQPAIPGAIASGVSNNAVQNSPPANVHRAAEQMGRIANVNQLSNGQFEFRLVLPTGSLAGVEIKITTAGTNRVSLNVRSTRGRIKGDALADLVQRMGENGITVVGMEVE